MPRAAAAPRVVVNNRSRDDDDETVEESSSSSEDEDAVEEEEDEEEEEEEDVEEAEDEADDGERGKATKSAAAAGARPPAQGGDKRPPAGQGRLTLSLGSKNDVCKVCGKRGHKAGFVGATYLDCPNRPCYLCKLTGHTTATCPYRIAPGHGCTPAAGSGAAAGGSCDATRGSLLHGRNLLGALESRECYGSRPPLLLRRPPVPRFQVEAAILKIHTRRCCTLEFHPTHNGIVVSGDKKGGLAVWNFDQVHERTVYDTVHSCLANSIRFLPWLGADGGMSCVTASSDGTAKLVDMETGDWRPLLDLNPGGWVQGGPWHMVYGCDVSPSLGAVLVGDSNGSVHLLDPRTRGSVCSLQLHKKGNKVVSVHMHPLHPPLVLTAGNDHSARIFDIRELSSAPSATASAASGSAAPSAAAAAAAAIADARTAVAGSLLSASPPPKGTGAAAGDEVAGSSAPVAAAGGRKRGGGGAGAAATKAAAVAAVKGGGGSKKAGGGVAAHAELAVMPHPRVVNAAYFSPHTGRRILTTCQDNRLRVWDYAPYGCNGPADREIVHSHDFNRYLTPFKAEWDPKDPTESVFVVGRYISEDFGGEALHPVDLLSASDGALLRQLTDANLTTISPVNKPHPRRQLIISGSSRSLYLWAPVPEEEEDDEVEDVAQGERSRAAAAGGSGSSGAAGASRSAAAARGAGAAARASRTFVSFDADPAGGAKKRKKGGEVTPGGKGGGGAKKGGGGKGADFDDDDDD